VLRGQNEVADLLAELGASTEIPPNDLAVAAIARGERPDHPLPDQPDHDAQEVLALAALRGQLELVVELFGPNFFAHVGGGPPGTLLHHACWVGNPQTVARLLDLGADPIARSGAKHGTPLAWAVLGSEAYHTPGRDYVAVAERLIAAGAELEPRFIDAAQGPLLEWLEERI
jgi:ankyrin repeat protein